MVKRGLVQAVYNQQISSTGMLHRLLFVSVAEATNDRLRLSGCHCSCTDAKVVILMAAVRSVIELLWAESSGGAYSI